MVLIPLCGSVVLTLRQWTEWLLVQFVGTGAVTAVLGPFLFKSKRAQETITSITSLDHRHLPVQLTVQVLDLSGKFLSRIKNDF